MAEAASAALRGLLGEGGVTIYNIGPDKYGGRVVADAATRRTDNVSAALIAAGHARGYVRGRRSAWCANSATPANEKSRAARAAFSRSIVRRLNQRVTTTVVPTETR